jgi:hypothetical protein
VRRVEVSHRLRQPIRIVDIDVAGIEDDQTGRDLGVILEAHDGNFRIVVQLRNDVDA